MDSLNRIDRPGAVYKTRTTDADMALINALAKTALTADEVYTFAVRLCDNEIDRDFERFDVSALQTLGELFTGVSGIFDHDWSARGQTARLYRTEVVRCDESTAAGDPLQYLKGYAYMLRSEKNRDLIDEIEAGIKKEVSVGCSVAKRVCSVCGGENCGHVPGRTYGGRLCYLTLSEPTDAYEWSFVAVPAQRGSGIVKTFGADGRSDRSGALEREARLGRAYLRSLKRELVRLAGLSDGELDLKLFSRAADRLDEEELLELTAAFRRRAREVFPPQPQIRSHASAPENGGDDVFQV